MTNPLMNLVAKGEGSYNDYNRGTKEKSEGDHVILPATSVVDLSNTTLSEIRRRQHLGIEDPDRMGAVGRYQMIKPTLGLGINALGVDVSEKFTPELQDRFFNDYLISTKKGRIRQYISGKAGVSLRDAQKDVATEWASVEDPDTPGTIYQPYIRYGNKLHTSAADVAVVLDEMRAYYNARIQEGMAPEEAWRSTSSMGPGEHSHKLRTRPPGKDGETLRAGAHSETVARYQRHLHSLGYTAAGGRHLDIDGRFGDDTRIATQAFQRDHGLVADGVAGRRTQAAVAEAISLHSIGSPDAAYLRDIQPSTTVPYVAAAEAPSVLATYQTFAQQPLAAMPLVEQQGEMDLAREARVDSRNAHDLDDSGIRKLQDDLTALGITNHHGNPLAATGQYDDETRMAVMGFQMDLGLPVSGEPDVATVALADARASIARMQSLRDIPMIAAPQMPGEPEQELSKESMVVPREHVQATTAMPFSDPSHPQHALYADLKEQLPEQISEMRLAQFTAACHKGGIGPGEIEAIQIIDDRAVFVGAMAGFAEVDMNLRPTIEQSVEQAQVFDQQRAMEMNQQAQEMQQSQGMSMSM
jgi:peptidoglycan hydrolase-like protein with peptidoglycan-binding domain